MNCSEKDLSIFSAITYSEEQKKGRFLSKKVLVFRVETDMSQPFSEDFGIEMMAYMTLLVSRQISSYEQGFCKTHLLLIYLDNTVPAYYTYTNSVEKLEKDSLIHKFFPGVVGPIYRGCLLPREIYLLIWAQHLCPMNSTYQK